MDRLGSLPDDILTRILSSVPTKQAVATSILSKRWIHLWRYVPVLDFTETNMEDLESVRRFKEFVSSFLLLRKAAGNHSINTFILGIQRYSSPIHAPGDNYLDMMRRTTYHNTLIRKLTLAPSLPISILTCTTLVVLKLRWFWFFKDANSHYNFPSLKTLHLKDIYLHHQHEFTFLLDACPLLEDLQLSNIHFDPSARFSSLYRKQQLRCSSLKRLNKADITDHGCYFMVKSLSNVEFLRIQLCKGYCPPNDFPTFHNLTHLVLNYNCDIIVQVLYHCPKLQNLDFYEDLNTTRDYKQNWVDPESVPSCLSLNLTTCNMRDFVVVDQHRNRIMLARFILDNARVLETMSIWCYKRWPKAERVLSSCPKASATCQLTIDCGCKFTFKRHNKRTKNGR
ncbi:putative FBD-associated F-box protein At5g56820 [Medicago truncatula]|nr:putative FBD-associated F-box protein At5g56820 [Medicago truncatula]